MKIADLIDKLSLTLYSGVNNDIKEVTSGYVSDLLSDVMGNANENAVWITIQNHKNVVAVATLKDISAVILAKGIAPNDDMLKFAVEENLTVLGSEKEVFELAGEIYQIINS